jgi:Domain of unknown function (DUF1707)/Domain of unknown function (DUF4190)
MTAESYSGAMRASDHDRSLVQSVLNDAYAEGRLTQDEWDERATALMTAATYADLDRLTADLPRHYPGPEYGAQVSLVPPAPPDRAEPQPTSGLAFAALVFAFAQVLIGFPAGIAAVVLGHKALRRIRTTREPGAWLARAALVLGYVGIALTLLVLVFGFGGLEMHMHRHTYP